MSVKRLSKTNEFVTIDEIGNGVLIVEYTEVIGMDTPDGEHTEIPGRKHYMTAANEQVNANTNGSYTVVGKNVLLKRPQ